MWIAKPSSSAAFIDEGGAYQNKIGVLYADAYTLKESRETES